MANIKRVTIEGDTPFDLYENVELQPLLAFLAGPVSGLQLEWFGEGRKIGPNQFGGYTQCYNFRLSGQEALRWEWFDIFTETIIEIGGRITGYDVVDIEG